LSFGVFGVYTLIYGVPNVFYTKDFVELGVLDVYATYFGLFYIYSTAFWVYFYTISFGVF